MALTKEELEKIPLPLSDEDYALIFENLQNLPFTLRSVSKELDLAFDKKAAEIYDARHPGNNLWFDEIPWEPPLTEEERAKLGKPESKDNKSEFDNGAISSQKSQEIPDDIINSPAYKKYVLLSRASKKVNDRLALEEVAFKLIKEGDGTDRGQWVNDLMIYHAKEVAAVFGSNPFEVGGLLEDMWDSSKYEDIDTGLCMSWSDWAAFFCNDVTKRVYSYFVEEHKKRSYYEEEEERMRNKLSHLKELLD